MKKLDELFEGVDELFEGVAELMKRASELVDNSFKKMNKKNSLVTGDFYNGKVVIEMETLQRTVKIAMDVTSWNKLKNSIDKKIG